MERGYKSDNQGFIGRYCKENKDILDKIIIIADPSGRAV
jgi:hypothetical protein